MAKIQARKRTQFDTIARAIKPAVNALGAALQKNGVQIMSEPKFCFWADDQGKQIVAMTFMFTPEAIAKMMPTAPEAVVNI
jgi:hypothetical protein